MTSRMIRGHFLMIAAAIFTVATSQLGNAQINVFTPAGVEIDANGVLRTRLFSDPTGQLTKQRYEAAKASLNEDVQTPSQLRKISLNRLEAAIQARLDAGEPVDEVMQNLAGLTQITHVFYYPETKDIVIAGPAEGFFTDISGRVVGMETGKAIMRLEDLIVALRAFPASQQKSGVIGCSIDPTQEGLANFKQAVTELAMKTASNQISVAGNEAAIADTLRQAMGMQTVTVKGVSDRSHFAQKLVEADYRMKLIGIGLEQPAVDIPSYVENVNPTKVAKNALIRWYFTPNYDRIRVNEDETAMQLVGQSVQLVGAGEMVQGDGSRVKRGGTNSASEKFCRKFTERFEDLAEKTPVFADLRNLMDMTIVAAYIQEMDYYGQAGWDASLFADNDKLNVDVHQAPTQVEPAMNAGWKNGMFMTPIAGGVNIQARQALTTDNMKLDEAGEIDQARNAISFDGLADGQWWWD